eukprot:3381208-Pyramimonas_sp.AAC.1
MGLVAPCEPLHLNLRWGATWGHEPCEGRAEIGAVVPCEPCHWGLERSSLYEAANRVTRWAEFSYARLVVCSSPPRTTS